MRVDEVMELSDYWRVHPPTVDLVRAIAIGLGWKPPERELPQRSFKEALAETGDMFRGLGRWFPQ
jgi:hypothetical protein